MEPVPSWSTKLNDCVFSWLLLFCCHCLWFNADKRHRGEVVSLPSRPAVRESATAESLSVDHLSISDDENWSAPLSLPCVDDDVDSPGCGCARTSYVLPSERWSAKRKRHDDAMALKHIKTSSKPTWIDGLGHDTNDSRSQVSDNQSNVGGRSSQTGQVASLTPSPAKSGTPSSATSSPLKPVDKRVPATKAQPPTPSEPSSMSRSPLKRHSEGSIKTGVQDDDIGVTRTRLSVANSGSKMGLPSTESLTKTRPSVTESSKRAHPSPAQTKNMSLLPVSPTSAAVSSIVGMSPPATPVVPEPQVTQCRKQSRQKGRTQRDPNSLPCKGNKAWFTFNVC